MQNDMKIDGFEISTWHAEHIPDEDMPYHAVNMTCSRELLEGYELTDEEKTSLPEMMGGYCRLIDERGLIGFGRTEFEAIQDLFSNASLVDA